MTRFLVGLDLGKRRDFSALAAVERAEVDVGLNGVTFERVIEQRLSVRYLERVPLGTAYMDVIERVRSVVDSPELLGRCTLVVDATGGGIPVMEMIRAARLGCPVAEVNITSGDRVTECSGGWNVPKRDLITRLQLIFEQKQLKIASRLRDADTLARELMGLRMRISAEGHDSYGARQEKVHDDLALAVALACWAAKGPISKPVYGTKSLGLGW